MILVFATTLAFALDNDAQTVTLIVGQVMEVQLVNAVSLNFPMTINTAVAGAQPTNALDNNNTYLRFTSLVDAVKNHRITVTGSTFGAPKGTNLYVSATAPVGGTGTAGGTYNNRVVITSNNGSGATFTGGDLITNLGSCYTGVTPTSGANLNYEFEVTTPTALELDAGKACLVTYTMLDM
jgi:hypothetical protein